MLISFCIDELDDSASEMNSIDTPQNVNQGFFIDVVGYGHSSIAVPLIEVVIAIQHVLYLFVCLSLLLNIPGESHYSYYGFIFFVLAAITTTYLSTILRLLREIFVVSNLLPL